MAQQRRRPEGQDCSHPPAGTRDLPVADRVDADMKPVQPPTRHAMVDGTSAEPERRKLRARDDAVLPVREPGDSQLT